MLLPFSPVCIGLGFQATKAYGYANKHWKTALNYCTNLGATHLFLQWNVE